MLKHGDELYDSARVDHDTRWDLPLLERNETLVYMQRILERVIEQASHEVRSLRDAEGYDQEYFLNLVLLHEQMHDEAITYTRQILSYPAPKFAVVNNERIEEQRTSPFAQTNYCLMGDAEIPGGRFILGSAEPWFRDHKILRGGCWATRSGLIHNSYRNFYTPDRRDVWAGFRTCALQS